ncbi:MAG: hypothetical protein JKY52_19710 [Flavobacteriales bacterium]|nr:hypothetical protein [Flavobacteriales bacterium]
MKKYSKNVLRIHGTVIIFAGLALTVLGWIGTFQGKGMMAILESEPIGYIGLFQAYLLMACFGIVLWMASNLEERRIWHLAGFLAHSAPLAANIVFWDQIESYGISHNGIMLHITFMTIQAITYLFYEQKQPANTA